MDRLDKLVWIVMFQEDSRCTCFHDLKRCRVGHASRHHENSRRTMAIVEVNEQAVSLLVAEVVIEQDHVGWSF
jgi:hypothetical protein